jgi:hypothetical protein
MAVLRFQRTITDAEEKNYYLNLTDDNGERYGTRFPPDHTLLWVLTPNGRRYKASKRGDNQIWGVLRSWYAGESIHAGTVVEISYDQAAQPIDGRIPITITTVQLSSATVEPPTTESTEELEEIESAEVSLKLERDLEDFIVENLHIIEPDLVLYQDENGQSGRQYPTDVGTIDILCKNQSDFVLVELKKGRTSDQVVGQISRYIGWIKEFVAEQGQNIRGIIIVHDFDPKLKYAVRAHDNLQLKYYEIQLKFIDEAEAVNKSGG